jgi:NTP pyrophosphatase (non-canonical NTP hydrolase)
MKCKLCGNNKLFVDAHCAGCGAQGYDVTEATISELVYLAHDTAVEKGWWESPRSDGECIALMHSELSEALEALREDIMSDHIPEFKGVEEELADVLIRVFGFAGARGLNLGAALKAKMEFNRTRPHRHGGKKF